MEFESPDVEKDFPGLYASESGKRSQESDFSDEAHDRPSKKDLLIGKRKEKKESKKDQGYAALEGESSPEEELDVKSPSKSKKSKAFKFPTIKEKREKSREKEVLRDKEKDKEKEKEKEADKEKDKKKDVKAKLKLKDRKKSKHGEDGIDLGDEMPVFGVPLTVAVERSRCHDGVELPLIVRECIDHVQECGLIVEGIYKMSGVKSKVQQLRRNYNQREPVKLSDYDLPTVTSLLKTFLRELPEPLLTTDLISRFEDAGGIRELTAREQELLTLVDQLPLCHRICLSWIIKHLDSIAAHERQNKMGVNALGVTLGTVLQMSPRLLGALLTHCRVLFPDIRLTKYIPPLSAASLALPSSRTEISGELAKQESLLNQIHSEMNHGYITKRREEQLWEVQRLITQLKRKLRSLEKEAAQPQQDDPAVTACATGSSTASVIPVAPTLQSSSTTAVVTVTPVSMNRLQRSPSGENIDCRPQVISGEANVVKGETGSDVDEAATCATAVIQPAVVGDEVDTAADSGSVSSNSSRPAESAVEQNSVNGLEDQASQLRLQLEHRELLNLQAELEARAKRERDSVERLRVEIAALQRAVRCSSARCTARSNSDAEAMSGGCNSIPDENKDDKQRESELLKQNSQLVQNKSTLVRQIMSEREACLQLRVQLGLLQLRVQLGLAQLQKGNHT